MATHNDLETSVASREKEVKDALFDNQEPIIVDDLIQIGAVSITIGEQAVERSHANLPEKLKKIHKV